MTIEATYDGPIPVNLMDPKLLGCPFAAYARQRREAPVYQMPGSGIFMVMSYDLCVEATKMTDVFSNKFQKIVAPKPEVMEVYGKAGIAPPPPTLLTNDPPDHARFRGLVDKVFAPGRVKKMEGYIDEIVHQLIDRFIDKGGCELVTEFAVPLPLSIIADELGVPREDMPKFKEWSDASVVPFSSLVTIEEEVAAAHKIVEFQAYFTEKLAEKRANPTDDIISDLATTHLVGEERQLTTPEFLNIIQQLLTAGNETTTSTIAAAMQKLIDNPDQQALLSAEPDKYARMVGEETLRMEAPVQGQWRVCAKDVEFGGVHIPEGAVVNLRYGAANRDESQFEDPDRFDLTRKNAMRHLAFGHGPHFCVGANLSRKELEMAFKGLFKRLKNFRYQDGKNDFTHHPSFVLRGLKELHIEFDKA